MKIGYIIAILVLIWIFMMYFSLIFVTKPVTYECLDDEQVANYLKNGYDVVFKSLGNTSEEAEKCATQPSCFPKICIDGKNHYKLIPPEEGEKDEN